MNKLGILLAASLLALSAPGAVSCAGGGGDSDTDGDTDGDSDGDTDGDADGTCGPCGEVSLGDSTVSGDLRVDGFFRAVVRMQGAADSNKAEFREQLEALAAAFGVEYYEEMELDALAAEVKATIEAEISANVGGGLRVVYLPPECTSDVSVAVAAQAQCEAQAGCEVSIDYGGNGYAPVACEGVCTGLCSGECSGTCAVPSDGECEGTCRGACVLAEPVSAPGECLGICRGACSGACSLADPVGECKGECIGICDGVCETAPGAACAGGCHGECVVEVSAECEGECRGLCDAECDGRCEGAAVPPSGSAAGSCEATADCQPGAAAQGMASLWCTPPQLDFDFDFSGGVDESARADFLARMEVFRAQMTAITQRAFELRALVDAGYAAELGFDPPVVVVAAQLDALLAADLSEFDIAAGRLPCVMPALEESIDILGSLATDSAATIDEQMNILAILGG